MNAMTIRETVSALADGQLEGEEFACAVRDICASPDALATWHSYHLIGDALRSSELADGTSPGAFVERLRARLSVEAEAATPSRAEELTVALVHNAAAPPVAANDASFRWKIAAGCASLAAVAAITWGLVGGAGVGPTELAKATPAASPTLSGVANEGQVMIRDSRLDELLAAHRQFGGGSALQMPAGFLRNATYEGSAR